MFSPKITTTCLIGVPVELSCSACTAMGANICVAHMSAATDVASAFCITDPLFGHFVALTADRKGIAGSPLLGCHDSITVRRKDRDESREAPPTRRAAARPKWL